VFWNPDVFPTIWSPPLLPIAWNPNSIPIIITGTIISIRRMINAVMDKRRYPDHWRTDHHPEMRVGVMVMMGPIPGES
jgi:hypothetical protein